ncbi:MAG TPA: thiol:disulfide interchange protein DsbA/DsbL [Burkholderiales bacterium]|nr:thiol:disulfide interchange protein DsbA/DsbL [Burkholderiales bacterium]
MVFRLLSVLSGLFFALAAHAQSSPVEGVDYIELKPPQAVESSGKIEVLEFFWYRCPHCYALEPDLESWAKRLPRDVQLKRIPGILNDDWAIDARIFYTLEAIGELERLHRPLFDTIHQQGGVRLRGDAFAKWTADWLATQNVDMARYDAAFRSFTVESKLRRAAQMSRAYRLDGVPTLAVQGRYLVVATTSRKAMLAAADFLIGETRRQLARAKP